MEYPERPTEDQILAWLRLYDFEGHRPRQVRAISTSLPRIARILWLRYCAEPPLSALAVAGESGLSSGYIAELTRRGLLRLAAVEEQGDLAAGWDPESPLGQAVARWRAQHRSFASLWGLPK